MLVLSSLLPNPVGNKAKRWTDMRKTCVDFCSSFNIVIQSISIQHGCNAFVWRTFCLSFRVRRSSSELKVPPTSADWSKKNLGIGFEPSWIHRKSNNEINPMIMTRLWMPLYKLLELKSKGGQIREHHILSPTKGIKTSSCMNWSLPPQLPSRHAYGYEILLLCSYPSLLKYIPVSPGWNNRILKYIKCLCVCLELVAGITG